MIHEHTNEVTIGRWYTILPDDTSIRHWTVTWTPNVSEGDEPDWEEREESFPTMGAALERATYLLDLARTRETCCAEDQP